MSFISSKTIVWTQFVLDQNLLLSKFVSDPPCLGLEITFGPHIFSWETKEIVCTTFKTQNLLYATFFFDPTLWAKKNLGSIFFTPNIIEHFYGHPVGKKDWIEIILGRKIVG